MVSFPDAVLLKSMRRLNTVVLLMRTNFTISSIVTLKLYSLPAIIKAEAKGIKVYVKSRVTDRKKNDNSFFRLNLVALGWNRFLYLRSKFSINFLLHFFAKKIDFISGKIV